MADKVWKAPWPDATKEENESYAAAIESMNMEWEIEIADQMGPYGSEFIDADKAAVWGVPPSSYRAFYAPPKWEKAVGSKYLKQMAKSQGREIEPDSVVVTNPLWADAFTWAHEFRHRAVETERRERYGESSDPLNPAGQFLGRMHFEKRNRLWDAYLSRDKKDWKTSVAGWRDYVHHETGTGLTLEDAEADLRKTIEEHKDGLINEEAASKWEGVPMEIDDLRRLYKKGYERRSKTWNEE